MIKWTFDKSSKMIVSKHEGIITGEEHLQYVRDILSAENAPRDLRILEHAAKATYQFDVEFNEEIKAIVESKITGFNTIMSAVIQTKPLETAYVIDFKMKTQLPNFKCKVFYEPDNAKKWLNKPFAEAEDYY